mmetsp:Transcript_1030/g.1603  ORF Transcript_1030/g.1603 Transcript_1030/m.1603 type:complete len:400 (-) Transcript_1030:36-1235(-)
MITRIAKHTRQNIATTLTRNIKRSYAVAMKKTALFDLHKKYEGKMVPFAGYSMPVVYADKNFEESHHHTRKNASIFDVSHMGQLIITGEKRYEFIESLVPGNIKDLKVNNARLTQLTNEEGGILDDCIITKKKDHLYMVVNAACAEQDIEILRNQMKNYEGVEMEILSDRSLIALQGPKAAEVLQDITKHDFTYQNFMSTKELDIQGETCFVSRCGYTGEDGFEISIPSSAVESITETLLENEAVALAGLGARDTLRLEAGLCLMGQDMTPQRTPIEAGLRFTIGKRRREEKNFPGADVIMDQWRDGTPQTRIGFIMEDERIARPNHKILNEEGQEVGVVTSGGMGHTLGKPVGMGYVDKDYAADGTPLIIDFKRKRHFKAKVASTPFVPSHYYRAPKK